MNGILQRGILCGLFFLCAGVALASPSVAVKGLFGNKAILEINGEDRLVRAGERTPEGVLLVSSDSRQAVVEVDGVTRSLGLSAQIASTFTDSRVPEVRVSQSPDSHYRVQGAINGRPVEMLVDTGATAIAMNAGHARALGIDFRKGQPRQASTAGGMVDSYLVDLNRVSVGDIDVHNIKGIVIEGEFPSQILLGNTFLKHVNLQQEAGSLILKGRF